MKILLIGANGQVGHLIKKNNIHGHEIYESYRTDLDITDRGSIMSRCDKIKPDLIINASAYTAVDNAEKEPAKSYDVNQNGVKFLAEACKTHDIVLIHISTDYVFDGKKNKPYSEEDIENPTGVYGKSKLNGETEIKKILDKHIIIRTSWVFGEHGNNFVKTMLKAGKERDELSIVNDQFGGPTYAGDIAQAIFKVIYYINKRKNINWGTYHFSGMPHVTWYEFAKKIFANAENKNIFNKSPILKPIMTKDYPTPAKRPKNSSLNCTKIKKEFNIPPSDWQLELSNIKNYES